MIPVELKTNSVSCVSFISFSWFSARLQAWTSLPLCPAANAGKKETRSRSEGPTGPCNGKQMAACSDGSRLPSAVQERKLLIRCHPSSWRRTGEEDGGGQPDRGQPPNVWPLSNVSALAHSWLAPQHTSGNTRHERALGAVHLFWLTLGFLASHEAYSFQRGEAFPPFSSLSLTAAPPSRLASG